MRFAPLDGVRIVDFSWNVAGPTATKVLAALGADVIKIEYPTRADPGRVMSFSPIVEGVYDSGGFFADVNVGKRSVTIDPRQPDGIALIERLIERSEVLVESYSPRVMTGWGLSFERMREINPGIVYLSVSGFGHTGPYGSYVSYGPTAQAASGATYASGAPGRPPAGWGYSFLDVMTGYQAAFAVVAALHEPRSDRQGQRIDLSQVETGAAMLAPVLIDSLVNGTVTEGESFPPGNRASAGGRVDGYRYELGAPYNVYRTADEGTDGFCAITVMNDEQWAALSRVMGEPAWAADPKFADLPARLAHQDELDAHVGAWARGFGKYELMDRLQAAGVPAGALQSGRNRVESDPSLAARGVFQRLAHAIVGEYRFESMPVHVDGQPLPLRAQWPLLGKDTDRVLADVLELPDTERKRLAEAGVTWPVGLPRPAYLSEEA